jgi:folate-dependent phosphoribosylglycinamide formyltransferase PurN
LKIGIATGTDSGRYLHGIYDSLKDSDLQPDFILYCFPEARTFRVFKFALGALYRILRALLPARVLRFAYKPRLPWPHPRKFYAKGINSRRAQDILMTERPDAVVVFNCGIVGKALCEGFHQVLLNAHAGKLPEYRGMNNVEWAYLEGKPLVGTVHFMAHQIDTGDIVLEREFAKENSPTTIENIRHGAFLQTYGLFPEAIRMLQQKDFRPVRQEAGKRTTRYVLHPFIRGILEKKLALAGEKDGILGLQNQPS